MVRPKGPLGPERAMKISGETSSTSRCVRRVTAERSVGRSGPDRTKERLYLPEGPALHLHLVQVVMVVVDR